MKYLLVAFFMGIEIKEEPMVLVSVSINFILYKEASMKKMNFMDLGLRKHLIHQPISLGAFTKVEKMVLLWKRIKNKLDMLNIVKIFL